MNTDAQHSRPPKQCSALTNMRCKYGHATNSGCHMLSAVGVYAQDPPCMRDDYVFDEAKQIVTHKKFK
jgi:hypothetical protein